MNVVKDKNEQPKKDKYDGETAKAYIMKLKVVEPRKVEIDLLSFCTNTNANLMKRFNSSDESYCT
jgi:hypothetical protein